MTGKVSLKIEIVRRRRAAPTALSPGDDVDDLFEQPHRRLVRQLSIQGIERLQYTFHPVNAIVERFARLAREDPDRPLLHFALSHRP